MALLTALRGNQNTTRLLNYLKSSPKQYPCLTKEEEREMIRENAGDRQRLNKLLFMHNIRMVFSMAGRYVSKHRDFDTVVQDGMVGLATAAQRFEPEKNIKFCTYAMIWVKKYMSGYYYTNQFRKIDSQTVSLSSPASASSDEGDQPFEAVVQNYMDPSLATRAGDIDCALSADERSEICADLYARLTDDASLSATEKAVFTDMFVEREKTRDIAEKYKLGSDQISEIKHKILRKFKDILATGYSVTSMADL